MSQLPLFYLLVTILLTSLSQLLQKKAAMELNRSDAPQPLLSNISFVLSGVFLGVSLVTWLFVLQHFDVSLAYPMLSMNYILVLILARTCLGENISSRRWIGVVSIVAGVAILSIDST